jgi:Ca2+-binding RTX toxin-like protein
MATFLGGSADDVLVGGAENDYLSGISGDDLLLATRAKTPWSAEPRRE